MDTIDLELSNVRNDGTCNFKVSEVRQEAFRKVRSPYGYPLNSCVHRSQ